MDTCRGCLCENDTQEIEKDYRMIVSLFPTPLLHSEFKFKPSLLDWVKDYYKHSSYHEGNSSSAGWHSEYNLHEEQSFLEHSLLIYSHIADSIKNISDAPFCINSMWASVNKPGDYNYSHTHLGVDFSGVLYLQTPFNCGDIVFEDENARFRYNWKLDQEVKEEKGLHDSVWFHPTPGRCLIFPAHLRHKVERNNSKEDRISIGFNLKFR